MSEKKSGVVARDQSDVLLVLLAVVGYAEVDPNGDGEALVWMICGRTRPATAERVLLALRHADPYRPPEPTALELARTAERLLAIAEEHAQAWETFDGRMAPREYALVGLGVLLS